MALPDYTRNVYSAQKFGDVSVCRIVATIGATGAVTRVAAESSPETTISRSTTGQYAITFPKSETAFPFRPVVVLAEGVGSDAYWEALSATAGTGSFETAVNTASDTAADPADGAKIYIMLLLGAN